MNIVKLTQIDWKKSTLKLMKM